NVRQSNANLVAMSLHLRLAQDSVDTALAPLSEMKKNRLQTTPLHVDSDELRGEDAAAREGDSGREPEYLSVRGRRRSICLLTARSGYVRCFPDSFEAGDQ